MGIIKNSQNKSGELSDSSSGTSSGGSFRDFTQSNVAEVATDVAIGQGVKSLGLQYGSSTLSQALDDIEDGTFDPSGLAYSAAKDVATKAIGGVPGMVAGMVADVGYGLATDQEGLAKSMTGKVGSVTGAMVGSAFGPIGTYAGSMIGGTLGNMAYSSYESGMVGDAFGSRSQEGVRDSMENSGFSRSQTADMASEDSAMGRSLGKSTHSSGYSVSPGLQSSSSLYGAADKSFGDYSSLGSMASGEMGGEGSGGGDGNDNDSGAGGGTGSSGDGSGGTGANGGEDGGASDGNDW